MEEERSVIGHGFRNDLSCNVIVRSLSPRNTSLLELILERHTYRKGRRKGHGSDPFRRFIGLLREQSSRLAVHGPCASWNEITRIRDFRFLASCFSTRTCCPLLSPCPGKISKILVYNRYVYL